MCTVLRLGLEVELGSRPWLGLNYRYRARIGIRLSIKSLVLIDFVHWYMAKVWFMLRTRLDTRLDVMI